MDYTAWKFWLYVGQLLATVGLWIYVWWSNREKVTARRFAKLEAEVMGRVSAAELEKAHAERDADCDRHQGRTAALEISLRDLPTRREIAALSADMGKVLRQVGHMEGRLEGVGRALDLINEHLINQGGQRP